MLHLQFYYREGCHLCEAMWFELSDYLCRDELGFTCINIVGDESLEKRYGNMIPVLAHDDEVICNYFLDSERLDTFVEAH